MCFSPEADLVGATVIGAIGIDVLRHVDKRTHHLALAALPLVLAVHQLIESFVWFSLQGHLPHDVGRVALWGYLLIAFCLLPILVPVGVMLAEPKGRRWVAAPFAVIGFGVALDLFVSMLTGPVSVRLSSYHLSYSIKVSDGLLVVALYVAAVCGSLLCSEYRLVRLFGLVNLVAVGVIAWLTIDGFASVWCGWAAVSSGVIALRMRRLQLPHRHRTPMTTAAA